MSPINKKVLSETDIISKVVVRGNLGVRKTVNTAQLKREITSGEFLSPQELWAKLCAFKGYSVQQLPIISRDYCDDDNDKTPLYYLIQAIDKNEKYVMKITCEDEIGKGQLDNFFTSKEAYPVIATSSELMTLGVDAKTYNLVSEKRWKIILLIPPVQEQRKFVIKVDKLMTCNSLKAKLNQAQTTQNQLTDTVVEQAIF